MIARQIAAAILIVAASAAVAGGLSVVDGDTVKLDGQSVRLVGFDAPEQGDHARCESERLLADRATARLRSIVAAGATLAPVPCACKPGTEGTRRCNYGRACGVLSINGRDVAAVMIEEGLAHPYQCFGTRCPRRRSWCD